MRSTRLTVFIGTVAVAGTAAGLYATGGLDRLLEMGIQRREMVRIKEKEKQLSDGISRMVESEMPTGDEQGMTAGDSRSRTKGAAREKLERTFDVVVDVAESTSTSTSGSGDGAKACGAIEYAGSGPENLRVDRALWTNFMADYHRAKEDLVGWLHANASAFPKNRLARMELEIRETRVMRPQSQIEPDLAWRGIAAWTRPRAGTIVEGERPVLIHVSDGFLKLYQKDRDRARFEITRTLAQAWSPCEVEGGKVGATWSELMQCLGYSKEQIGCTAGTVSEGGWAASTAVAVLVAPPACEIPAFAGEKYQACLGRFKRAETASYTVEVPERSLASQSGGSGNSEE